MYNMSLSNKVKKWVDNKVITKQQGEKILSFERKNNNKFFWKTAYIIAGFFIGLGICLIISSNWWRVPPFVKLGGDFIIFASFIYMLYKSIINKDTFKKELFIILSYLMTGTTIGLIAQIYHLNGSWFSFSLTWSLLTIPFILYSCSRLTNYYWMFLLSSSLLNTKWFQDFFDYLEEYFYAVVLTTIGLSLLSYIAKLLDKRYRKFTLIPSAFAQIAMLSAYFITLFLGGYWGFSHFISNDYSFSNDTPSYIKLLANIFIYGFLAVRMFIAVKKQDITSFKRNAFLIETYAFIYFALRYYDLLSSGIGFIIGGLLILLFIYILKKTLTSVKKLEIFK